MTHRPGRRAVLFMLLATVGAFASCTVAPGRDGSTTGATPSSRRGGPPNTGAPSDPASGSAAAEVGSFRLDPGNGRPTIRVFYANGATDPATARIVVVMHGTERNASEYRDTWVPLAAEHHLIVVAPEFTERDFPGVNGYNLGGMWDRDDDPVEASRWTFRYVDALFDETVRRWGSEAVTFDMYGHSAGAQFVHRYLMFTPDARVRRAVAANAGWYTMPDASINFPYGIKRAPGPDAQTATLSTQALETCLKRDLVVLAGADDVESENLRQDRGAREQGETRVERAVEFHRRGAKAADDEGVTFGWTLVVVPGVSHDHRPMSAVAVTYFD